MAELLDTQLFAAYLMNEVSLFQPTKNLHSALGSVILLPWFYRCQHGFPTRILVVLRQHVLKGTCLYFLVTVLLFP
jgi:hypothetical protein